MNGYIIKSGQIDNIFIVLIIALYQRTHIYNYVLTITILRKVNQILWFANSIKLFSNYSQLSLYFSTPGLRTCFVIIRYNLH